MHTHAILSAVFLAVASISHASDSSGQSRKGITDPLSVVQDSRQLQEDGKPTSDSYPPGSTTLTANRKALLNDVFKKVKGIKLEIVIVVGHSDLTEGATEAEQQTLSENRALEVKRYLVSQGLDPNRIYTEGKGATQPVCGMADAEKQCLNRRVEIEVIGTKSKK